MFAWDHVNHHLQIGASAGPALLLHDHVGLHGSDVAYGVAPSVDFRIGYSEAWSRVQKRMFVVAEPKLRWIAGRPNWVLGVVIGSGTGW